MDLKDDNKLIGLIIVIVIIIASVSVYQFTKEDDDEEKETIKIGAIISQTGPGATLGNDMLKGMQLGVLDVNNDGGVNGRKIELILKDSETNADVAVNCFQEIETDHQPIAYVSLLSSISIALGPLAEQNEVTLMAGIATAPAVTVNAPWTYRYWPISTIEAPPVLGILEDEGAMNISVLYVDDDFGKSMNNYTKDVWTKGNVTGVPFSIGTSNFSTHIEDIMDTDAVYIICFDSHLFNILPQLNQANYTGVIACNNAVSTPESRTIADAEGVFTSAPAIYNPNFVFASAISQEFEAYAGIQFNHYHANGYDMILMIAGLLNGNEISRENLKAQLDAGFIHPGVFGDVSVQPGEHDINFPVFSARIENGEVVYL